ncbi:hypothetical protein HYR69_02505 [Candidatus Sumerlaeota bacterium]|nr:hypothetical protein [Candidatus Sumerlaeota bacterium]
MSCLRAYAMGGAILRGEMKPSRVHVIGEPDKKKSAAAVSCSRGTFASLMGISVATRVKGNGVPRVLLFVLFSADPDGHPPFKPGRTA